MIYIDTISLLCALRKQSYTDTHSTNNIKLKIMLIFCPVFLNLLVMKIHYIWLVYLGKLLTKSLILKICPLTVFRTDGSRVTCHGINDPAGEAQVAGAPKQLMDYRGQRVNSYTGGSYGALLKATG